jgi:hypothetical protein
LPEIDRFIQSACLLDCPSLVIEFGNGSGQELKLLLNVSQAKKLKGSQNGLIQAAENLKKTLLNSLKKMTAFVFFASVKLLKK